MEESVNSVQKLLPDFIIIDDDSINNMICRKTIQVVFPTVNIKTFTTPEAGLEYIHNLQEDTKTNVILFLDINMPGLNGWDVLELFKELPEKIRARFKIFMLSSSIDPLDKQKADSDPFTTGYISKPLNNTVLNNIASYL